MFHLTQEQINYEVEKEYAFDFFRKQPRTSPSMLVSNQTRYKYGKIPSPWKEIWYRNVGRLALADE